MNGNPSIIVADPGWVYNGRKRVRKDGSPSKFGLGVSGRFTTETVEEMASIPVSVLAAPTSQLYLWTTWPHLHSGLDLMEKWGFDYKTVAFVWIKTNRARWKDVQKQLAVLQEQGPADFMDWLCFFGTGHYTAANSEIVLLGTRGEYMKPAIRLSQVFAYPGWRGAEHSRKPDCVHEAIELMYPGLCYAELFARRQYPGWLCLGNDLDGRDLRESIPAYLSSI